MLLVDPPTRVRLAEVVPADPWARVRVGLVVAYTVGYVWWFLAEGLIIDRISVTMSVALLLAITTVGRPLRHWVRLGRDLVLYAAMWFAYEESRGVADHLGMPLQVESVRNIDRFLFAGHDAPVVLQRNFYDRAHVRWYDVAGSLLYFSHFVVPIAVIVVLWIRNRRQWVRFMRRFASLLLIACAMFVIVPTAPPWMAAGGDRNIKLSAMEPLMRTTSRGWPYLGLHGFVHAWDTGRDWANAVAAMPSLHAGFAMFLVVFALPWVPRRWVRVLMFAYPIGMITALAYFGEHYVADALVAWLIIAVVFVAWDRIERATRRRRVQKACTALGVPPPAPVAVPA